MICPKCGAETPLQKAFCVRCGGFLELGRSEVKDAVAAEALSEAQLALTRRAGNWLAVSLVILLLAFVFRRSHMENALPRFHESAVIPFLDLDPSHPLSQVPVPELELEVPKP